MKGTFIIEYIDPEKGLTISKIPNTHVDDGKEFALDMIFGIRNWFDPGSTTTTWSEMQNRYLAIGDSTNTNAGVTGPASGASIGTGGAWLGVDPEDSALTSEIARKVCVAARALGNVQTKLYASFGDSELGTGQVSIHEVGIFLGSGSNTPAGDPTLSETYRPEAMISKAVLYTTSGGRYVINPITRAAGTDITIWHTFGVEDH